MSDPFGRTILGLDPLTGALILPWWVAGALLALLVAFLALAFSRAGREDVADGLARIALVGVGAAVTWIFLAGTSQSDPGAERRALEARVSALAVRASTPGSPLACLDAMAGDTVERFCEPTLFASPEAMASAVSYVTAQLNLLADLSAFVRRGAAAMEPVLTGLRRAVETDRYGLVAHVLATRDGCTAEQCATMALLQDARRVTANLAARTYDFYVGRHSAAWPASPPGPSAQAPPGPAAGTIPGMTPGLPPGAAAFAAPRSAPGPDVFFPTPDSIPPVNIMTAEPANEPASTGTARTPARRPPQSLQPAAAAPQPQPAPPSRQQPAPIDLNAAARGAPVTAQ